MALTPSTIKAAHGAKRTSKRVGRGNASQKGTYSGRGLKGQRSRSGGKSGTQLRGFKQSLQKVPKIRGFKSMHPKKQVVTLATLERVCKNGDTVTPWSLEQIGVVDKPKHGVKIVATGELKKKLTVEECLASKAAVEAIEKAGGTITF